MKPTCCDILETWCKWESVQDCYMVTSRDLQRAEIHPCLSDNLQIQDTQWGRQRVIWILGFYYCLGNNYTTPTSESFYQLWLVILLTEVAFYREAATPDNSFNSRPGLNSTGNTVSTLDSFNTSHSFNLRHKVSSCSKSLYFFILEMLNYILVAKVKNRHFYWNSFIFNVF